MTVQFGPVVLLQISNVLSSAANAVTTMVTAWLVLDLTGSPALTGFVVAAMGIPALLAAPFTGWAIDYWGRRRVAVAADAVSALTLFLVPLLAYFDALTFARVLVISVAGAIFDPTGYSARKTLIVDVANAAQISVQKLNGIHDGLFAAGWIVGPALGAAVLSLLGSSYALVVPGVMCVISAVVMMGVHQDRAAEPEPKDDSNPGDTSQDGFLEGLRVTWRDPVLRDTTLIIVVLAGIYLPTETVLLPAHFQAINSPLDLGLVLGLMSAGGFIGALAYGWLEGWMSRYQIILMIMIGSAVTLVFMGNLPAAPWLAFFGFLSGLCWAPFNPLMTTLVQERVPEDVQGRVFSIQTSAFYALPPVFATLVGLTTEVWGVRTVYFALAWICAIACLLVCFLPSLRQMEPQPPNPDGPLAEPGR